MEIDDIRGFTDDELNTELDVTRRALMNLRFREATMQLVNVNELRRARKRIARIETVKRERDLARAAR